MTVVGDAGVGKSRLRYELLRRLAARAGLSGLPLALPGERVDLQHVRDGIWSMTSPHFTTTHDYRLLVEYGDEPGVFRPA